jgi:hypothetical protein
VFGRPLSGGHCLAQGKSLAVRLATCKRTVGQSDHRTDVQHATPTSKPDDRLAVNSSQSEGDREAGEQGAGRRKPGSPSPAVAQSTIDNRQSAIDRQSSQLGGGSGSRSRSSNR